MFLKLFKIVFGVNTFFSKVFKNIWTLNFEKTLNFETLNYDLLGDFGKWSFFVKPNGFTEVSSLVNLKPPLIMGGFMRLLRFFF